MTTRAPLQFLLLGLSLVALACGSDAVTESGESGPVSHDLSEPVSEQDIDRARDTFDAGQQRWNDFDPFPYTMTIGIQTISAVEVEVVDGVARSVTIIEGEPDRVANFPQTIEEVFAVVDGMIAAFEDDPSIIPDEGECGHHLNVRFNTDWGFPEYYDGLGPCDDGVGFFVEIVPLDTEAS